MTDPGDLQRILHSAQILFLAFQDDPAPYLIPVFFGHEEGKLYVHCARWGTKIDLLGAHPQVGFSAVADVQIVPAEAACDFTAHAESVVGTATASVVEEEAERAHGLDLIMRHYAPAATAAGLRYAPAALHRTQVIALTIVEIMGKRIGGPARQL